MAPARTMRPRFPPAPRPGKPVPAPPSTGTPIGLRALTQVINLLDPDAIVLGGGLSNMDHLYTAIPALLPRYVFSDVVTTRVLKNRHGDSSGVRGAAWLWPAS